ncbi:MAG TPA: hypothetical protein VF042_10995 [Gemmatimonadaceae bacterium]
MREIELREMLGVKVVDAGGAHIGRLEEIELERGKDSCAIVAYIVEHRGLLDRVSGWALTASLQAKLSKRSKSRPYRVGWDQMDLSDPSHPRVLVPKELLEKA